MSYTKIGCEAYILRDSKVLLGKRGKKAKGPWYGTWALPGGHLEFLERADDCIIREVQEELGVRVTPKDVELAAVSDDLRPEKDEHYVHLTFLVNIGNQEPKVNEPEMCEEWRWFPIDQLPENIFPFQAKIFETLRTKQIYKSA